MSFMDDFWYMSLTYVLFILLFWSHMVFTEVVITVSDDQSGSLHPYQKATV